MVWRNLEIYAGAGVEVTVKYIMRDENCSKHELRRFVCDAQRHGRPSLVGDFEYRYPDPNKKVTNGLAHLKLLASRAQLNFALSGPGYVAAPEAELDARVDMLLRRSALRHPRHCLGVVQQWFKTFTHPGPKGSALDIWYAATCQQTGGPDSSRASVAIWPASCWQVAIHFVLWLRMLHRMKRPQHFAAFPWAFKLLPAFVARFVLWLRLLHMIEASTEPWGISLGI